MSDNDRNPAGRFKPGNKAAAGNPHAKRVQELRTALLDAVSGEDFAAVVAGLIRAAKAGDVPAAKVLFDRVLGPSVPLDVLQRLDDLEARLTERKPA